jgi:hypothetical protein
MREAGRSGRVTRRSGRTTRSIDCARWPSILTTHVILIHDCCCQEVHVTSSHIWQQQSRANLACHVSHPEREGVRGPARGGPARAPPDKRGMLHAQLTSSHRISASLSALSSYYAHAHAHAQHARRVTRVTPAGAQSADAHLHPKPPDMVSSPHCECVRARAAVCHLIWSQVRVRVPHVCSCHHLEHLEHLEHSECGMQPLWCRGTPLHVQSRSWCRAHARSPAASARTALTVHVGDVSAHARTRL